MPQPPRDKLFSFEPVTPEGRQAQKMARKFMEGIKTPEQAFQVLKDIGLYNRDGTPNPYFYPDSGKKKASS